MNTETPRDNWRDTILAGLANYIDAGSIVAGSAAATLAGGVVTVGWPDAGPPMAATEHAAPKSPPRIARLINASSRMLELRWVS